jgi:D-inositol-3-phosphate glycosyltransferase
MHVPPRRPDRLAAALRELLPDEAKRRAFALNGVARAQARYGWERVAASTLDVYRDVQVGESEGKIEVLHL